jgi:anti-sigma regulatory factor (Ser/Thr protein kinase)
MPELHIHKELVASNDTRHLVKIREVVKDAATQAPFDEREVSRIVLAVDEAVSNIIEHAYEEPASGGDIRIVLDVDSSRFEVVIMDSGHEFDPSLVDVPDIAEHVRRGKKKGLGIFLMRQIMDEVKYTFIQGLRNELRMVKYAKNQGGQAQCQS